MILDAALVTIGVLLGLASLLGVAATLVALTIRLGRTRPVWWLRARLAARRLRRTT